MLTKSARLMLALLVLVGCRNNQPKQLQTHLYKDFDLYNKKGINEIDTNLKVNSNYKNETFYKIISHGGSPDSIIVSNPLGKGTKTMELRVVKGDSVSLYVTNYPYGGGESARSYYKTYYVFSSKRAIRYLCWDEGEWHVMFVSFNDAFGGAKVIEQKDTINLEKRLLKMDSIKMWQMPMHDIEKYSVRLNKGFTFNRWLHDRDFEIH